MRVFRKRSTASSSLLAFLAVAAVLVAPSAQAAPGDLDPSFGSAGTVLTDLGSSVDVARAVALQPNGKVIAAGYSAVGLGNFDFALVRYNADGSLDSSFGSGGKVVTDLGGSSVDEAWALAVQRNGKIVAAGRSTAGGTLDFAVVRYNPDGSLDSSFGAGGKVLTDLGASSFDESWAVAVQPNGKIVAAGLSNAGGTFDFALVRYNADGSIDQTFGAGGKVLTDLGNSQFDEARAVALMPSGEIVAAGRSVVGNTFDFAVVRYERDGSLDPTFGSGGKVLTDLGGSKFDEALDVALRPNGQVVAAGRSIAGGRFDFALVCYERDGSLDLTFGVGGKALTPVASTFDEANALALAPDGKIVAAGMGHAGTSLDFAVVRYTEDGNLDPSFGSGGKALTDLGTSSFEAAFAVALAPNGQVIAAGVSNASGSVDFALARYLGR